MITTAIILLYAIWQFAKPMHQKKGVVVITVIASLYWVFNVVVTWLYMRSQLTLENQQSPSENTQAAADSLSILAASLNIEILVLTAAIVLLLLILKKKRFKAP